MLSSFHFISFVFTIGMLLSSLANSLGKAEEIPKSDFDPTIHSVAIEYVEWRHHFQIASDVNNSDDLYMPNHWAIFISSNETVINGGCSLFGKFICISPDCYEDTSLHYSVNYPTFSSSQATRLSVSSQTISIANGAWRINSSPLYLHNCESKKEYLYNTSVFGQIGLGLTGNAYQNFQTTNPLFSIIFNNRFSAELIFGFNSTYVNESSTAITLSSDLDWKIQVNSMAIENSTLSNQTTTLIFDLETQYIALPPAYYSNLKKYLCQRSSPWSCIDQPRLNAFHFVYFGNINDLPSLVFHLENGTQFVLTPAAYTIKDPRVATHEARFDLYDSTFSGTDYIVLGRSVMFHHCIVFQQLNNQTHAITLYPVAHTYLNSDFSPTEELSDPLILPTRGGTLSSTIPASSETENTPVIITNTSDTQSSYKSDTNPIESPQSTLETPKDNTEEQNPILLIILVVILIVIIGGVASYMCLNRPDKTVKEHRSTVELNRSSYFVSTSESIQVDQENSVFE